MSVIVNADDFGLDANATGAIDEAFCKGYISSTTLCANGGDFRNAVTLALKHGYADRIGVHLNLTEGKPLTEGIQRFSLFCNALGDLKRGAYRLLTASEADALYCELDAQISRMQEAGIPVTHVDSHHHVHTNPFILPVVITVAKKHGIHQMRIHRNVCNTSLRKQAAFWVINQGIRCSGFRTTDWFGSMQEVLSCYSDDMQKDSIEIMVHPRYDSSHRLIDADVNAREAVLLQECYVKLCSAMPEVTLLSY